MIVTIIKLGFLSITYHFKIIKSISLSFKMHIHRDDLVMKTVGDKLVTQLKAGIQ